jgi:hypothetical protein
MATIGQQLTQPEPGWRRIDSNDSRITYTGQYWQSRGYAGSWGGSVMLFDYSMTGQFKYETATFLFFGTKVRLIAQMDVNRTPKAEVIIDGVVHGYCNQRLPTGASLKQQMLVYEAADLPQGLHKVSLRNISDWGMPSLDAIDIDIDGRILHTTEKETIGEIKEFGDRIIQRYTAAPNSLGVFTELGTTKSELIPPASTPNPDGAFYWIYVDDDHLGRKKFIADRNIQNTISWDALNAEGVATASGIQPTKTIFSGTNYIDGGNAPDLFITGDITYGARFKLNKLPSSYACILNMVALGESLDTNTLYFLLINRNGGLRIGHEYGAGSDQIYETQGNYVKANEEISVTIVRDSPNKKYYVYINGEYKETISYDYQPQIATSGNKHRLSIGMDSGSVSAGGYYMEGELYRLYIWDRACKNDEIAAYEKYKLTGKEIGLVRLIDYSFGGNYKGIMRLPTGGINTTDTDNEWDRYIVQRDYGTGPGHNDVWNWKGIASWTSTTPPGGTTARWQRGNGAVSSRTSSTSFTTTNSGFRPVMLVEELSKKHYLFESKGKLYGVSPDKNSLVEIIESATDETFISQGVNERDISSILQRGLHLSLENPSLCLYYSEPQSGEKTVTLPVVPKDTFIPARDDIDISEVERVDAFRLTVNESGKGKVMVLYSPDSGASWWAVSGGLWTNVDINNPEEMKAKAMTADAFNAVTPEQWDEMLQRSGTARLGYYLSKESASDVAETDYVELQVDMFGAMEHVNETDYQYAYISPSKIRIQLKKSGDYMINVPV